MCPVMCQHVEDTAKEEAMQEIEQAADAAADLDGGALVEAAAEAVQKRGIVGPAFCLAQIALT